MKIIEVKGVRVDELTIGDCFLSDERLFVYTGPDGTGALTAVEIEVGDDWDFDEDEIVYPVDVEVRWRYK